MKEKHIWDSRTCEIKLHQHYFFIFFLFLFDTSMPP